MTLAKYIFSNNNLTNIWENNKNLRLDYKSFLPLISLSSNKIKIMKNCESTTFGFMPAKSRLVTLPYIVSVSLHWHQLKRSTESKISSDPRTHELSPKIRRANAPEKKSIVLLTGQNQINKWFNMVTFLCSCYVQTLITFSKLALFVYWFVSILIFFGLSIFFLWVICSGNVNLHVKDDVIYCSMEQMCG